MTTPPPLPTKVHSNLFWSDPVQFRDAGVPRLAVLLLNAPHSAWRVRTHIGPHAPPIHASELFWTLWSSAQVTMCADGGANRLFDRSVKVDAQDVVAAPQCIKGDLDSLRDDVRAFYTARGTQVIHDADQHSNDLDKCLAHIADVQQSDCNHDTKFTVVIFGAMGGRFDQEMQNINALFRWHDTFADIVLLSDDTTARLLLPGYRHVLEPNFAFETRTCGLIPIAGACHETTTSGLKWNLQQQATHFGGLLSSSNHVDEAQDVVTVENSAPLIWTTELQQ